MAHYIDKAALVAEIEKLKGKISDDSSYCNGWQHALRMLEIELNTLEVKEVDLNLDNELDKYIENSNAFIKDDFVVEMNNGDSFNHIYDLEGVAKHFYSLGLQAQKGE